jgi:hypothetical protein
MKKDEKDRLINRVRTLRAKTFNVSFEHRPHDMFPDEWVLFINQNEYQRQSISVLPNEVDKLIKMLESMKRDMQKKGFYNAS